MFRHFITALMMSAPLAFTALPAQAAANDVTAAQTEAYNKAIKSFNAGQAAQQSGDNVAALARYEEALPAIKDMAAAQPDKIDNIKFLANVLYLAAAAKASSQSFDAAVPLLEESVPYWRIVLANEEPDAQSRALLTTIVTQLGNAKLAKKDKQGATPYYTEGLDLARTLVRTAPDGTNRNLLLGVLIGASQTIGTDAIKSEAASLSKAMLAGGTVNAANQPAAEILAQSAT